MDTSSTADLAEYQGGVCDWYDLGCNLSSFSEWLFNAILFIPRKAFQLLMEGLAAVVNAIPVPDWVSGVSGGISAIPPGVMWLAEVAHLEQGMAILLSAYVLRFVIRRLPFIG